MLLTPFLPSWSPPNSSIHKYASCSKECFILALIYIDRLIQKNNFLLTELNVHRVVITAILLAAKFFDDAYYNNAYYAKVGGVLVEEINNLEVQFLFKIDFSLRVLPEVFEKYNAELISHSNAMGLERIAHSTDEELMRAPQAQHHEVVAAPGQQEHHQICPQAVAQPQAQLQQMYSADLQTFSAEMEPSLAYPNPVEGSASHYPIQAIHHSVAAPMQQVHMAGQHQQQQMFDTVQPFPNLAAQVSVQHQAQLAHGNPSELDLVYCSGAPTAAAPQDGAVYSQGPDFGMAPTPGYQASNVDGYSTHYPDQQGAVMAQAQAQGYPQHTHYFNDGGAAQTTQPMVHNYPEITPSPPPQPPMHHIHGAPITYAGDMGCSAQLAGVAYLNSTSASAHHYATPAEAALGLHHHQQLFPSRPIAIGGNTIAQDNAWSRMFSAEQVATTPTCSA